MIESGMIFESTDKRRPPRRIRVEDIETWHDPVAGWEAEYARCTEKRQGENLFSGETHILVDHLTSRHNWKRVK